jgi:inorganic triphosphatase YgiF
MDAAPKLAESETTVVAGESAVVAPARAGSSSSSSSDEEKAAKKAKNKSRSQSRKRASIFGGLLGKKDKEHKDGEAVKAEPEVKKDEPTVVPHLDESMCIWSSPLNLY